MVQVDVFWSFGLGAGFAVASARQLRVRQELRARDADGDRARQLAVAGETGEWNGGTAELRASLTPDSDGANGGGRSRAGGERAAGAAEPRAAGSLADFSDLLQNRFMVQNILYAALLFAPSGIYLLWEFTNWETMQAGAKSMPAWLIVLFAITNVTQAILGFWVTERLIVRGRQYLGLLAAWAGYFGMFFLLVNGWDKTGWHRFFSEDRADFKAWSSEPAIDQVTAWLTSDVALTLYAMGLILIPAMALIMIRSIGGGYRIGGDYTPSRKPIALPLKVATTAAVLLSGVPAAIVAHNLIVALGWIAGALVSAAIIFVVLLWTRTGLLYRGYKLMALEDAAYERLRAGGSSGSGRPRESRDRQPSYSNQ
ncbi:MAG: hypothetical protein HZB14_08110 [Actinobacteria bacterium]|nr:hypothetical protein [Actinomycetota bacterium]